VTTEVAPPASEGPKDGQLEQEAQEAPTSIEQAKVNPLFRVALRTDADNPSLQWSALRLVQACKKLDQIKPINDGIMEKLRIIKWPWARGVFEAQNGKGLHWEMPYDPGIVTEEDIRGASFVASDILHYVRSSLDHLVYNVSWKDAGERRKNTQFPIIDNLDDWTPGLIAGCLGGMSPHHAAWIKDVQPFEGVEWIKILRDLSNADKHRVGVEVSPTVQFEIDAGAIHSDPQDANLQRAAIKNVTLQFLLPAVSDYGQEIGNVFDAMFIGAGELINKFLDEAGTSRIQVTRPSQS
jgi:hypothetical protein